MSKKSKKKTIIILIILVPILIVFGFIYYKINFNDLSINEVSVPETIEETSDNRNQNLQENRKPGKPDIQEEESEVTEILEEDYQDVEEEADVDESIEEQIEITPSLQEDLSPVYISHSKSLFRDKDRSFINNPRLTPENRDLLKIDEIKAGINFRDVPSEHFLTGKTYYDGNNGRLESIIYVAQDGKMHEYLISYDREGKYVDNIEIGLFIPGNDKSKYATISVDKLSVFEVQSSKELDKREEIVTEYYISPNLQFRKGKTFSRLK